MVQTGWLSQTIQAKFKLGKLLMTRGVADRSAENSDFAKFILASLRRHAAGDWGDLTQDDKEENDFSLKKGNLRIFSAYEHPSLPKIWIITEADHSATTTLFPDEY